MNEEIKKVTMKSTKKELLETVEQMNRILQEKESIMLDPEKIKSRTKSKETISKANEIISTDPNALIYDLKLSINKELITISEKLEEETSKYSELNDAILLKQIELKEIYGIEQQTASLAVLIESQKVLRQEFDDEMNEAKDEWRKERNKISESWKEQQDKKVTDRNRENEQFIYNRDRKREIDQNNFNDKVGELNKELKQKTEVFEVKWKIKLKELNEREEEISSQEKSIEQLKTLVDNFPEELKKAEGAVKGKVETRLQKSYDQDAALMKMQFEGECNVLNSKITTLEVLTSEQARQIVKLENTQEKAYQQVQDIANKAVSGASERPQNLTIQSNDQKSPK